MVLIGLDLSVAFDTVICKILLQQLQFEFGATDTLVLASLLPGRADLVR